MRWVKTAEVPPPEMITVLGWDGGSKFCFFYRTGAIDTRWMCLGGIITNPYESRVAPATHWTPLTAPTADDVVDPTEVCNEKALTRFFELIDTLKDAAVTVAAGIPFKK